MIRTNMSLLITGTQSIDFAVEALRMAFTEDHEGGGEPVRLEVGDSVAPGAAPSSGIKNWFPGGQFHRVTMQDAEQFGEEITGEIVGEYEKRVSAYAENYLNGILRTIKGCDNPYEGAYFEQPIADKQPLASYVKLMLVLNKMNITVCLSHEKSTGRVYRVKLARK